MPSVDRNNRLNKHQFAMIMDWIFKDAATGFFSLKKQIVRATALAGTCALLIGCNDSPIETSYYEFDDFRFEEHEMEVMDYQGNMAVSNFTPDINDFVFSKDHEQEPADVIQIFPGAKALFSYSSNRFEPQQLDASYTRNGDEIHFKINPADTGGDTTELLFTEFQNTLWTSAYGIKMMRTSAASDAVLWISGTGYYGTLKKHVQTYLQIMAEDDVLFVQKFNVAYRKKEF